MCMCACMWGSSRCSSFDSLTAAPVAVAGARILRDHRDGKLPQLPTSTSIPSFFTPEENVMPVSVEMLPVPVDGITLPSALKFPDSCTLADHVRIRHNRCQPPKNDNLGADHIRSVFHGRIF